MTATDDVLAVNYLMRRPLVRDEVERVLRALGLANYEIKKREPHKPSRPGGTQGTTGASQPPSVSRTGVSRKRGTDPRASVGPVPYAG